MEDPEDAQSGIAWCFAAILAFMAMLLIRHIFELFDSSMSDGPAAHSQQEPGGSHSPFSIGGNPGAGMLVMWLIVRFLVILIPMYAVLRVMHTIRDQQMQQDADRELEQEMMTLLWVRAILLSERKSAKAGIEPCFIRENAGSVLWYPVLTADSLCMTQTLSGNSAPLLSCMHLCHGM